MATLCSIATGNASASGTWATCSSAAENDTEAGQATLGTTDGTGADSSGFVLAAGDYDAIAVRLYSRLGSTGTLTIKLRNDTAGTNAITVTVNVSDIPNITSIQGGWLVFKTGTPYTANGTDSFKIRCYTSSATQVSLYMTSGTNWARQVRSTTTAAPASGDKLLVAGEYTGTGTSNSYTVTWDYTTGTHPTRFGAQTASATALAICSKGTLTLGTSASTNYAMYLGGNLWIYPNATCNFGTNGTNLPSTSSFDLKLDCVSNVDYAIELRSGATVCTFNIYGNPITNIAAKLTVDASSSATSLTTDISTGWKNGETVALPSTSRTISECESKALTADASGTALTISATGSAHSGTNNSSGDIRCRLVNLTRNIKIHGAGTIGSSTTQGYINIAATAVVTWRYAEFYNMGSGLDSGNRRGITPLTTTGTFDCQYCSLHDFTVTGSRGIYCQGSSGSGVTFSNNVTFNINDAHYANLATSGVQTISGNYFIKNVQNAICNLSDAGSTFTNNFVCGAANICVNLNETAQLGTFSGNDICCSTTSGMQIGNVTSGTISTCRFYRTSSAGVTVSTTCIYRVTWDTCTFFGNTTAGIITSLGNIIDGRFQSCTFDGGAVLSAQTVGITITTTLCGITAYFQDCTFGATNAHSTADINLVNASITSPNANSFIQARLHNCLLSSNETNNRNTMSEDSWIKSSKHDQNTGLYKAYTRNGIISIDTTIYDVTPAQRVQPFVNSGEKMESAPITISLDSGANATVTVKTRKSSSGDGAAYTGANQRLVLKKNVAAGITADVVLATASAGTGSWETLTGNIGPSGTAGTTTNDNAGLQIVVDCDGAAGWINVDTAAVNVQNDAGTMKYWMDGIPVPGITQLIASGILMHPGMGGRLNG